jgi:hypothetical protein
VKKRDICLQGNFNGTCSEGKSKNLFARSA